MKGQEELKTERGFHFAKLRPSILNYALYVILFIILAIVVIMKPEFLDWQNLLNILKQASTKGILALGVAGTILLAGTDLSVGRILGLCSVVCASLLQSVTYAARYYPQITENVPLVVPLLLSILIAVALSAFTGFCVSKLHMHAFIVTLGMQLVAYGGACIYIENQAAGTAQSLSMLDTRYVNLAIGSLKIGAFSIPYLVLYFIALAVIVHIIWTRTKLGKNMFAVGGNSEAASVSGVNIPKTIMCVYIMAGIMYGIASFLEAARIGSVNSSTGINYELDAIAACVIGGVSFNGGVGTIPGVVVGIIILQSINYSLYYLGINAYIQYIIKGAIIILAVAIDVRKYIAKK